MLIKTKRLHLNGSYHGVTVALRQQRQEKPSGPVSFPGIGRRTNSLGPPSLPKRALRGTLASRGADRMAYYADYYNCVRTHRSLNKDAPVSRPVQRTGVISSRAILAGLHHHYARLKFSYTPGLTGALDAHRPMKLM